MTKQPNQEPFYSDELVRLPPNFADSVLELEMRMDSDDSDLQCITQLNELYKLAVEYFVNVDTKKAAHFQKKLTSLLTSPKTLQLIEPRQKAKVEISKAIGLTTSIKDEMSKFNTQAESFVKNIIESTEKKLERSQSLIRLSITNQQDRLKNRLMQRTQSRKYL